MKFFHNEKLSLAWAIVVELVVHGIMAFGAFLLGGFLGEIALTSIVGPIGAQIGAWALGLFVFGAAFQAFVLGEYMKEHVASFERTAKGDGSYMANWQRVRWLVGGIEMASLAFRCLVSVQHADYLQAVIIGVFGALALWYAYAQAKVIHASVNRPAEYDVYKTNQRMTRDLVSDALKFTGSMTAEEKARYLQGDLSVIDDARGRQRSKRQQQAAERERKQAEKEQEQEVQEARKRIEEEQYKQAGDFFGKLISPFGDAHPTQNQADRMSQNGNSKSQLR